jgi:hypothetical protein
MAIKDKDVRIRVKAARYLAAAEKVGLTEWFALAKEQPSFARYIAASSIIKQIEKQWDITKDPLPEISGKDFMDNSEKIRRFSDIVGQWQKWSEQYPRFSSKFFDKDKNNWIKEN